MPAETMPWLQELMDKWPWLSMVLMGLGALVIFGQMVVTITPTKKDDLWLENAKKGVLGKVMDFFKAFAPYQKK
jgi:hypothetical protein